MKQYLGGIKVDDKRISVLEGYDLQVLRTYKGRGALICETDQGLKILREYIGRESRIEFQDRLLLRIRQAGMTCVDFYVRNKENQILSTDKMNHTYILKDWYEGAECNIYQPEEIKAAVQNMALLHRAMECPAAEGMEEMLIHSVKEEFLKHTRELKKILHYMRRRSCKSEFELYFARHYDEFYQEAEDVLRRIQDWDETEFQKQIRRRGQLCHGEYTHHNVIMCRQGTATINFEKYQLDTPIHDLYQFMRKVLEKNEWSVSIGELILTTYEQISPLTGEERENLYFRLAYPEKFWKMANYYYNSNKAWIPEKNIEKLRRLVEQNSAKHSFLKQCMIN